MADKKISALTGASTPLAGTEVFPIVQSGATVKATINNALTAGLPASFSTLTTTGATSIGAQLSAVTGSWGARLYTSSPTAAGAATLDFATQANRSLGSQIIGDNTGTGGIQFWTNAANTKNVEMLSTGNTQFNSGNLVQGTAAKGINFTANTPAAGMTSQLLNWYEEGTWTPAGNGITYSAASGTYTRIGRLVTCTFTVTFPATASGSNAQVMGLPFTAGTNYAVALSGYTSGINAALNGGTSLVYFANLTGTAFITNATLSTQVIIGTVSYSV